MPGMSATQSYTVRCFLMDEFGYVVAHGRYVQPNLTGAVLAHIAAQARRTDRAFAAPEKRPLR